MNYICGVRGFRGQAQQSFWGETAQAVRRADLSAFHSKGESGLMPSYLERYRQGECEEVWAELLALGGRIRDQELYPDVQAVAHETMTRARANIELLVPRLTSLGYQFAHRDRVFVPADEETRRFVSEVERRAGLLPLSLRAWCEVVGEVNLMGSHPKLSTYVQSRKGQELGQSFLALFAKHSGRATAPGDPLQQAFATSRRLLDEVVQQVKTGQPRSPDVEAGVRASMEFIANLNRPAASEGASLGPDVETDPLVVELYFGDLEDNMDEGEKNEEGMDEGPFQAVIAPDAVHKTGQSGGLPYSIAFPDPAVDALLLGEEDYGTFVEYLRICFRWGGFPGLRAFANPPREELAFLTQGLMRL
jgi:hypothetical protein